jgi:hypothetical protein
MISDTGSERESCVNICQELLDHTSENENFLKRIITGNETWVYGYDVKMKMQSLQWVRKNLPRPKKAQLLRSNVKVKWTVLFDIKGVVDHHL